MMELANKLTILRNFTARQAELANTDKAWCWTDGVALFPEARCPWCANTMISNRVWQVEGTQLLGRWKVADGKLVKEGSVGKNMHPHVSGTEICMGRMTERNRDSGERLHNTSALTALFLGMSPGDSYWGGGQDSEIHRWKCWLLDVFDHQCEPYCGAVEAEDCPRDGAACEEHQIARGEIQRCVRCGFAGPLFAPHACYCPCLCGCRPGIIHAGRLPCNCGCVACRCPEVRPPEGWVNPTPTGGDCACGCGCNPDRGECGCGCEECRCDSESPSYYCDWCDESSDEEHEHDLRTCEDCVTQYDSNVEGRFCSHCDQYVCSNCSDEHNHDDGDDDF